MKSQLQKAVGSKVTITNVSGNKVKWRFADKDAHKAYGVRTYTMVKGQGVDSVAKEIKSISARM